MPEFPDEFFIVGADLSLNRPGFCVIRYAHGSIKLEKITCVDNKVNSKKTRGQKLLENVAMLKSLCDEYKPIYFVREASIKNARFGQRSGTAARTGISETVGVMDLFVWENSKTEWQEIYPTSIKKCITNNGRATKEDVAKALPNYVGDVEYTVDDESDAVAVAVAWLIKNELIKQIEMK